MAQRLLRSPVRLLPTLAIILSLSMWTEGSRSEQLATVAGPIAVTGTRPFASAVIDLNLHGYSEEEYFIEGTANILARKSDRRIHSDGFWDVSHESPKSYRTRFLVRKPVDQSVFNGVVIVEWLQASANFDKDVNWNWNHSEFLRGGYIWVGVSPQHTSVSDNATPPYKTLVEWNQARYSTLNIPHDDYAFDVFSQVVGALRSKRSPSSVDPLNGYEVEQVIAVGNTYAAHQLITYYNAVLPHTNLLDGMYISRAFKDSAPISSRTQMPETVRLRTDLSVPVIVLSTDAEALSNYPARQDDSPFYRYWEVASAAHTNSYWIPFMYQHMERDFGVPETSCTGVNELPHHFVGNAAIRALVKSLKEGKEIPSFPRVEMAYTNNDELSLLKDEVGNTRGGIRLPDVSVPVAIYSAGNPQGCPGAPGRTDYLDHGVLLSLYRDYSDYSQKYRDAIDASLDAGHLLEEDASVLKETLENRKYLFEAEVQKDRFHKSSAFVSGTTIK